MSAGAEGKWQWRAASDAGVWAHGAKWARPLSAAAPWVSLALIAALFGIMLLLQAWLIRRAKKKQ